MDIAQFGPWGLIAGGSEGVGEAFAQELAAAGINLVLVARRAEALEATAGRLRADHAIEVRTIAADLTSPSDLARIASETASLEIGFLICNAGSETDFADFHDSPLDRTRAVIGLNIVAPAELVHHFGAAMRQRKRGAIILMGSMAGFAGSPKIAVYAAAKAYTHIFAEGLWEEMRHHGVHVLGFVIGATNTPTMQRTIGFEMPGIPQPPEVARDALAHLAEGPLYVTASKQHDAEQMRAMERRAAVEQTSASAAMFTKFIADRQAGSA